MSISPSVLEQRPLRISEPKPIHYRAQDPLDRVSRRPTEVNKVPRPRNAFIIFRCQTISKLHSKDSAGLDRPPTPEKTLSKRAGVAWRQLSEEEKQVYKDLAEKERLEHQDKYPGYKYQPNRSKLNKTRVSGPPTRRERVESLVLRTTSRSGTSPESGESVCPSPVSGRSSPEASAIPIPSSADDSTHSLAHRRSMSLPHLVHEPYPFARTYFIEPTSCLSSPGLGPHRTSRRSSSARDRSYLPAAMTPPPDCAFDLQYPHTTIPFSSLAPHSSSLSLPDLVTLSEGLALDDATSSGYSTPQTSSSVHEHDHEFMHFPQAPPSGTLFHRRQRSNTAPSAIISPLAAVSTTLGAWNGAVTATAAATAGLPSFSVMSADEHYTSAPSSSHVSSPLTDGTVPYGEFFSPTGQESYGAPSSLSAPDPDVDMDRTPRRADFPIDVQGQYIQQHHALEYPSIHSSYELQSYAAGLEDLDIAVSSPYGSSCGASAAASYEDLDFSEYLTMNNY